MTIFHSPINDTGFRVKDGAVAFAVGGGTAEARCAADGAIRLCPLKFGTEAVIVGTTAEAELARSVHGYGSVREHDIGGRDVDLGNESCGDLLHVNGEEGGVRFQDVVDGT